MKIYHTIGEVAEMYGVNASLVRYYADEFPEIKPHKNKKGNRLFTTSDMTVFAKIFRLIREEGLSLAEVKTNLASQTLRPNPKAGSLPSDMPAKKTLRSRLLRLKGMLEELHKTVDPD